MNTPSNNPSNKSTGKRRAEAAAPDPSCLEDLAHQAEAAPPMASAAADGKAKAKYRISKHKKKKTGEPNGQNKVAEQDLTAAAVDKAAASGQSLSKRLDMGRCSSLSPAQQQRREQQRLEALSPADQAEYLRRQQEADAERQFASAASTCCAASSRSSRRNARCRAAHMPEPHTFSRDELEFADPATAKTHNGEGEVVVSDKDRLDHHIHDDLKLKADWECPPVTGRGKLDFNSFGCCMRCEGCRSEDPAKPGEYLATGGYDVQTAGELFEFHQARQAERPPALDRRRRARRRRRRGQAAGRHAGAARRA